MICSIEPLDSVIDRMKLSIVRGVCVCVYQMDEETLGAKLGRPGRSLEDTEQLLALPCRGEGAQGSDDKAPLPPTPWPAMMSDR